jgi:hypothetical protein
MRKTIPPQAWADLYNYESQLGPSTLPATHRVGKRRNPIPRANRIITFTADEIRLLDSLSGWVKKQFAPVKVSRGLLIGFALRLMESAIDQQKGNFDGVSDWGKLWDKLVGGSDE